MADCEKTSGNIKEDLSGENISLLILQELKLLRKDVNKIKIKMKTIENKVDNVLNKLKDSSGVQDHNYYTSDIEMHDENVDQQSVEPYVPTKPNCKNWVKPTEKTTTVANDILTELKGNKQIVEFSGLCEGTSINNLAGSNECCMVEIEVTGDTSRSKSQTQTFSFPYTSKQTETLTSNIIDLTESDDTEKTGLIDSSTDNISQVPVSTVESCTEPKRLHSITPVLPRPISVLQPLKNSHLYPAASNDSKPSLLPVLAGDLSDSVRINMTENNIVEYTCQKCETKLNSLHECEKHLLGHELLSCPDCSLKMEAYLLEKHVCDKNGDILDPLQCTICQKILSNKGNLGRHMKMCSVKPKPDPDMFYKTPDKLLTCTICDKKLSNKGNLGRHMKRHTQVSRFMCETCGKSYIDKGDLKRHYVQHTGDVSLTCKVCSKPFYRKDALREHMKGHM